jgi:hypothetical protein
MPRIRLLGGIGLACLGSVVIVGFPCAASSSPVSGTLLRLFEERMELATWKPGGPRPEQILQIFKDAIATGEPEVVMDLEGTVVRLAGRREIDLDPYLILIPDLKQLAREAGNVRLDLTGPLRKRAAIYRLSRGTREAVYRRAISELRDRPDFQVDYGAGAVTMTESWFSAATAALEEEMDDLLPAIEAGRAVTIDVTDGAALSLERHLHQVLIPLARARASGDWAARYLDLVQEAIDHDTVGQDPARLVREAAQRLVRKNRRDTVPRLKALVKAQQRKLTFSAKQDLSDQPRRMANALVGAVRSLGDPSFEERLWKSWHPASPEALELSIRNTVAHARWGQI